MTSLVLILNSKAIEKVIKAAKNTEIEVNTNGAENFTWMYETTGENAPQLDAAIRIAKKAMVLFFFSNISNMILRCARD